MDLFRRLFLIALCAGTLSGAVVTGAHLLSTVPIILEAETYEKAGEAAAPAPAADHHHADASQAHDHGGHDHGAGAWEPEDGLERTAYTGLTNIITGVAFALLLVSGYALAGGAVGWRRGLFWGLAGFAAFTLAPGLGLPAELPGTEAAPLAARQVWWASTAAATAGGLALVAFGPRAHWAVLGVVLIVLPHLVGAPQPAEHAAAAPEALIHRFIVAATVTSLVFWACLGATTGYLFQRLFRPV